MKGTTGLLESMEKKALWVYMMGKVNLIVMGLDSRVRLASVQIPQPLLASCTTLGSFTTLSPPSLIFLFCKMGIVSPRVAVRIK